MGGCHCPVSMHFLGRGVPGLGSCTTHACWRGITALSDHPVSQDFFKTHEYLESGRLVCPLNAQNRWQLPSPPSTLEPRVAQRFRCHSYTWTTITVWYCGQAFKVKIKAEQPLHQLLVSFYLFCFYRLYFLVGNWKRFSFL